MKVLCNKCEKEFELNNLYKEKFDVDGLCGKCRNRKNNGYHKYKKTKPCAECGKSILIESSLCYSCSQKGSKNRKYTNGWSIEKRLCSVCGNELSTGSKKGLCKDCYINFLKSPENPRHKFRKVVRKFYDEPGYTEWKMSVLTRDNWVCAICNKRERSYANAHHIRPKRDFPNLVLDINNGITLCKSCHRKLNSHEYEYIDIFETMIMAKIKIRELGEPCEMGMPNQAS